MSIITNKEHNIQNLHNKAPLKNTPVYKSSNLAKMSTTHLFIIEKGLSYFP